jgi:hypothetical protein
MATLHFVTQIDVLARQSAADALRFARGASDRRFQVIRSGATGAAVVEAYAIRNVVGGVRVD